MILPTSGVQVLRIPTGFRKCMHDPSVASTHEATKADEILSTTGLDTLWLSYDVLGGVEQLKGVF